MTKRNVILSCRSVIDRFVSSAQIAGDDASQFSSLQRSMIDRLEGMKILLSTDVPKWSVVCDHLVEAKAYDFVNFWADRGFAYSAVAARSPAHSAAESGQGGTFAEQIQQIALAVDAEAFPVLADTHNDTAPSGRGAFVVSSQFSFEKSAYCMTCQHHLDDASSCDHPFCEFFQPFSGDIFAASHASAPEIAQAGQGVNLNLYRHKARFFTRSIPLLLQRFNGSRPFSASSVRFSVQGAGQ